MTAAEAEETTVVRLLLFLPIKREVDDELTQKFIRLTLRRTDFLNFWMEIYGRKFGSLEVSRNFHGENLKALVTKTSFGES